MKRLFAFTRTHLSQERLAGGALVLAITQFAASFAGFLRDQAFSIVFPLESDPLGVASIYIASFRVSDLLFQMFVMSSLSVVVVPFLASHLAYGKKDEMNRMVTSIFMVFGIVFGITALVLAIIFPAIATYFVQFDGPALDLYIFYARIALFTNFLFVFGNTLGQYLIAVQRYWIYGLTPILWALGTILGTYFLTPYIGPNGPMIGTLIGTLIYVLFRLIGVMRSGFRFEKPKQGILHHELGQMGWLIIPRMAALGALQVQLLLFDRIGSGLGTGAIAINSFARNFQSVIIGVAGIALAQSAFSLLSQAAATKDYHRFWIYIRKGTIYNIFLTVPGAIGLALFAFIPAWLLHLESPVKEVFVVTLVIYAISIPFESINHLLLRGFYALKNTRIPAVTSVLSATFAIFTAYWFKDQLGIYALAAGYTVGQIVQLVLLWITLPMSAKR